MTPESRQVPLHHARFGLQSPRLTAEDEQGLAARKEAGDASARETLILSNIPLALEVARGFRGGIHRRHIEDLRSVAIAGLIRAVDRYEPGFVSGDRVVRFGSYAAHWIRAGLEVAIVEELSPIRVARWTTEAIRIRRKGRPMPAKFDTPESRECIAQAEKVIALGSSMRGSADLPDGASTLDLVASREEDDPARLAAASEADPELSRALARLEREHPMDHRVVSLVSPIDGSDPMTCSEAGRVVGRRYQLVTTYYRRGLALLRGYIEEERATDGATDGTIDAEATR